ncbi:hypothetical protein DYB25_009478 [Aphanomyces astaci]|uniref:Uncharacterized protein n=1 Tax=Aphanomyces astaci TaxID=112090 RepID=A0A397BWN6_APHAT|nr:hypothetical protein DYB25_009478 [Aphanomyces astaci]
MCSLRVTCRLHVHGAGFGVTCRYAHSEYELGWILKDAATGLMIGFVYDASYCMFQADLDDEYVVGTERILLPAGHDAVADVSQTDGSYRMFRREADEEFAFGTERTHIATSKLKASAFRMQI